MRSKQIALVTTGTDNNNSEEDVLQRAVEILSRAGTLREDRAALMESTGKRKCRCYYIDIAVRRGRVYHKAKKRKSVKRKRKK
jgi:hypothetical protein